MIPNPRFDPKRVIGRPPEQLTLREATELVGLTVALEIYTPETLPQRPAIEFLELPDA